MLYCIKYAIDVYRNDKEAWNNLIKSAMNTDSSWDKSAKGYLETYKEITMK